MARVFNLTQGLESFGIECGRLAKLPENILEVATEKSAHMQAEVEKRTLKARSVPLCFSSVYSFVECFQGSVGHLDLYGSVYQVPE